MYTIIAATALLISSAQAPQQPPSLPKSSLAVSKSVPTAWADVVAYFNAHATVRNATAEAMLQEEAEGGLATWERIYASSGGGDTSFGLRPGVLDGSGIGWPSLCLVVRFATNAEMNTAADMVEAVAGYRYGKLTKARAPYRQRGR